MKYCVSSVVGESVTFSDIVMLYEQVRTCRLYLNNIWASHKRLQNREKRFGEKRFFRPSPYIYGQYNSNPGNTQPFSPPNIVVASFVTKMTLYVTILLGKIRISSVWIGNVATSGCRQGRKSNLLVRREYFSDLFNTKITITSSSTNTTLYYRYLW